MSLIKMLESYRLQYHDFLLKHVTQDIDNFPNDEVRNTLKYGYNSDCPVVARMTTLMNSIFTHRMQAFMVTQRSFELILKEDTNNIYNSMSGGIWASIRDAMISQGHFSLLREPTKGKAGVYKLVEPEAVDILHQLHDIHVNSNKSDKWFPHMEKKLLEYWDTRAEENNTKMSKEERLHSAMKYLPGKGDKK